jgi:hypothetical protein
MVKARSDTIEGTSLSLGVLVVIAMSGTLVLGACLSALFIHLARRRHVLDEDDASFLERAEVENETDASRPESRSRRKLRKRIASPEDGNSLERSSSGMSKRVSLPILPPVFTKRHSSFDPFATQTANRRERSSWIDEDALHGPTVKKHKEPHRFSVRESWPLKAMAPTIPRVHSESPAAAQHELLVAGDLSIRMIPQPPRPVLIHTNSGGQAAQYAYHGGGSPTRQTGLLRLPGQGQRSISTDSTLSQILRSTEQRLQHGNAGGARRNFNQASTTPTRTGTSMESLPARTDGSWVTVSAAQTPSPTKSQSPNRPESGSAHHRQPSQCSVISEPDSLFADPSPGTYVPTALSSPSRPARDQPPPASPASTLSSALSTVYSEDERMDGVTQTTSAQSSNFLDEKGIYTARPVREADGDPFVSYMAPTVRPPPGWTMHTSRITQPLNRPPRLRARSGEQSPLSSISGNSSGSGWTVIPYNDQENTPKFSYVSPGAGGRGRPELLVTSPSATSVTSTPPSVDGGLIHGNIRSNPNPPERRQTWDYGNTKTLPTFAKSLAAESDSDDDMPPLPGTPELALVRPQPPPTLELLARERVNLSPITERSSPTLAGSPRRELTVLTVRHDEAARTRRRISPTKVPVAAAHGNAPAASNSTTVSRPPPVVPMVSTIAQLRRMNSAASAASDVSSTYSVNTALGDATRCNSLTVRGGGRNAKGSSKNYLAVGMNESPTKADRPSRLGGSGLVVNGKVVNGPRGYHGGAAGTGKNGVKSNNGLVISPKRVSVVKEEYSNASPDRQSDDSLGLYDVDGFLIGSPTC